MFFFFFFEFMFWSKRECFLFLMELNTILAIIQIFFSLPTLEKDLVKDQEIHLTTIPQRTLKSKEHCLAQKSIAFVWVTGKGIKRQTIFRKPLYLFIMRLYFVKASVDENKLSIQEICWFGVKQVLWWDLLYLYKSCIQQNWLIKITSVISVKNNEVTCIQINLNFYFWSKYLCTPSKCYFSVL